MAEDSVVEAFIAVVCAPLIDAAAVCCSDKKSGRSENLRYISTDFRSEATA